jgi:c-di-GMP-binding flagellar brake protein YcgR
MNGGASEKGAIYFLIAAVAIAVILIVVNLIKKGSGGGNAGGSSIARSKFFSRLALHRLARDAGLDYEQIKMLDFVFKADDVVEPEKSLANPSLLDRHFKRAYRLIETTNSNQETVRQHAILFSTRTILENSSIGTISSTRDIKEDTALIINNGRNKLNLNVLSAKTDNLVAEAPKNVLGTQIKIAKGTKLSVMFFTKDDKGFSFETRITGYTKYYGHQAMLLAHSNQIRLLAQRRYRRKQTTIACFMSLVYTEGSGKKQRMVVDKRRLSGNITDISVGGCSIKTTAPVKVGAKFRIEFTHGENDLAALGHVIRINRVGLSMIIYIKFLRVTQKSMNLINAFVYEYTDDSQERL